MVPIVGKDYKPGDAIHLIAEIPDDGPNSVSALTQLHSPTILGLAGGWGAVWRKIFPNLNVDESAVTIEVGQEPAPRRDTIIAIVCLLGILIFVVVLAIRWDSRI
jgi:hypothetical protein